MSIRIKINIKRALSMLMSIEMSIIPYISTKCRWRRQWFTLFARRDEKKK